MYFIFISQLHRCSSDAPMDLLVVAKFDTQRVTARAMMLDENRRRAKRRNVALLPLPRAGFGDSGDSRRSGSNRLPTAL